MNLAFFISTGCVYNLFELLVYKRRDLSFDSVFLSVEENVKRSVRRCTFSEPTSAVAEGLRDHVGLVAARVQP